MKEIIHNDDNLTLKEIMETVIRIKVLLINNGKIFIGNANNVYQFPGGHLESNEEFNTCLKREVLEETGIEIDDNEIEKPFMKVSMLNKDWPEAGRNRNCEIYYYAVNTNKRPDLSKTNYTENEKKNDFKIEEFDLKEAVDKIKENIPNNEMNKVISPDMISALEEYLRQLED